MVKARKMEFLKTTLVALLSFWLGTSYAQKAYTLEDMAIIQGRVLDDQTNVAVAATIVYELEPYSEDIGVRQTNLETGRYELTFLKGRSYKLMVSANDYSPLTTRIETHEDLEKDILLTSTLREVFTLKNLIFQRGQALIGEASYGDLDRLISLLKEKKGMKIQLEGHTDFAGNAKANMDLSQERVEAVKDYLVKKGIKKSRIKLKALGGSQPISRERTEEGRTANRRVEVRILNMDS